MCKLKRNNDNTPAAQKSHSDSDDFISEASFTSKYFLFGIFFCSFSVLSCTTYYVHKYLYPNTANESIVQVYGDDWRKDIEYENIFVNIDCDFPIITKRDLKLKSFSPSLLESPFVVKGVANNWKAFENWRKYNLTSNFGDRIIQVGSESSIVFGGGSGGIPMKFRDILNQMDTSNSSTEFDSFLFDVTVLDAIPELRNDFRIPNMFQFFDNQHAFEEKRVWHILSLGASRTGLPFHAHGTTWLAVVHGVKRWFVYPPGYAPPSHLFQSLTYNPLRRVEYWLREIYPLLASLPKPPLDDTTTTSSTSSDVETDSSNDASSTVKMEKGYRPLECVQRSGDVLYLPPAWLHMTINAGETIGIGGQAALMATDRLNIALQVLRSSPLDFEANRAAGISLAHIALNEEQSVEPHLHKYKSSLVQLTDKNFEPLVMQREDVWLVLFVSSAWSGPDVCALCRSAQLRALWDAVATGLSGRVSVGVLDVSEGSGEQRGQTGGGGGGGSHALRKKYNVTSLPSIKLYGGVTTTTASSTPPSGSCLSGLTGEVVECQQQSSSPSHELAAAEAVSPSDGSRGKGGEVVEDLPYDLRVIEQTAAVPSPPSTAPDKSRESLWRDIVSYALRKQEEAGWGTGSVTVVGAKARRLLIAAEKHFRTALSVNPLHPEVRGLLPEIASYRKDYDSMRRYLQEAEAVYRSVDMSQVSKAAEASYYHRLATVYLQNLMGESALPLLQRSIDISSEYIPALVDMAIAYLITKNSTATEKILRKIEEINPYHPAINNIRKQLWSSRR